MPLAFAKTGEEFEIVEMRGGMNFLKKVMEMGVYTGIKVRVISNPGNGPIIIALSDTRIALGRGMATRIFVKKLS